MNIRYNLFKKKAVNLNCLYFLKQLLENQQYLQSEEALAPAFYFSKAGIIKKAKFKTTLNYSRININLGDWNKLDQVASQIFIRTIPSFTTSAQTNCEELKEEIRKVNGLPLGLVVSANELFELYAKTSIHPEHWVDANVAHIHIPIEDFKADVHTDTLLAAVYLMRWYIENGFNLLVHCKAGRSRSALVVLLYLMIFGDEPNLAPGCDAETVIDYMVQGRKQVDMSRDKKQKSEEAFNLFDTNELPRLKKEFLIDPMNPVPIFKSYLSSLELKNALARTLSLKMMGGYYSKKQDSDRAESLLSFTKNLLNANDDAWYANFLLKRDEPLNNFLNADKLKMLDDWKKRKELIDLFELELNTILQVAFKSSESELGNYKNAYLKQLVEIQQVTNVCDQVLNEISHQFNFGLLK